MKLQVTSTIKWGSVDTPLITSSVHTLTSFFKLWLYTTYTEYLPTQEVEGYVNDMHNSIKEASEYELKLSRDTFRVEVVV